MKKFYLRFETIIIIFLLFCLFFLYSFVAVRMHDQFLTFGWDLGYFDQLIWKISQGIYPISSLSKVNLLAGHFSPILFFFAPFYLVWSDPRILLITQSFLVVFAALPLYFFSIRKTKSRLFSWIIIFSYLFFHGTQWSILNEFHEMTIAPLFIILVFWGLEFGNKTFFWSGIMGLLITKEEMSLLVAALCLVALIKYDQKRLGFLLFIFSMIFFFFLTEFFIPSISEKKALFHPKISQNAKTPFELTVQLLKDPTLFLKNITTPPEKLRTLFISFLSFGMIPLFAPFSVLIPIFEQFLMRFLYFGGQFTTWLNVNHHAAPIAILLPISCVYAAVALMEKYKKNKRRVVIVLSVVLFLSTVFQDVLLKAPIHSIFKKQLYESQSWMKNNKYIIEELKKISPTGSIAAQNNLFPHLSQRENIYLLPEITDAEYLVVDLEDGPNKFAPLQYDEMVKFIDQLISENKYFVYKTRGKAIILKRNI